MQIDKIVLTEKDKLILDSYCIMLDGLADYLGGSYEIVLHSLENLESSAIKVINGFHTHRKEGSPITDLALVMLEKLNKENMPNHVSYFSRNKYGEPLRSTTIAVRGENQRIIGVLCMNFYLNTPFLSILNHFGNTNEEGKLNISDIDEYFAGDVSEMILKTIDQATAKVNADVSIPTAFRKKFIISILDKGGIFKLKNAVPITAEALGVSHNTVYMHLRNSRNNHASK